MRVWMWVLCGLAALLGAMPATASAWNGPQTLGRAPGDAPPTVAANASGRVAVAWLGERTMEVRVAGPGRRFGSVRRVPGVAPNADPNEAQIAVGPRGQVVLAWHNLSERDTEEGPCCAFWRMTVGRNGRFVRNRLLSSRDVDSFDLRFAFDPRGRPWVAWSDYLERVLVARITTSGRIVDRRTVNGPDPEGVIELAGLRMPAGGPELLLLVSRGEFQERHALVSIRASRPPGRPRTLLESRTVNSTPVLGLDRFGPRLMLWDNNGDRVIAATRRGTGFSRERTLVRGRNSLFGKALAMNRAGAGFAGIVRNPIGRRSNIRVSFASVRSRLGRPRILRQARSDSSPPSVLLDDAGRADIAWGTTRDQIAIQSYLGRTIIGRRLISAPRAPEPCIDTYCPAAVGATVGRRGAIFVWRDGRRIRMIRRPG